MTRTLWSWPLLIACWTYLAVMAGILALALMGVRQPSPLALLEAFMPLLFVPLVAVLPLGLVLRSWTVLAGSLGLVAVFAMMYGPYFWPKDGPARVSDGGTIKIMTLNLAAGWAPEEEIVSSIRREAPDIVGLQELQASTAARLRADLADQYPYMILPPANFSNGILSRWPVLEYGLLPSAPRTWPPLHATIDWHGRTLSVVVVHVPSPHLIWAGKTLIPVGLLTGGQPSYVLEVARFVGTLPGNVVVMGDFNQTEQSFGYAEMSRVLKDAYREAGQGFGFTFPVGVTAGPWPVPGPLVRLDYIFHSPDLAAQQAYARCDSGSDHCYVVAQLTPAATSPASP